LALLSTEFEEGAQRTHAVGLYAAAAGIGGSLGLVLGGFFADLLSWRAGFFINLPIGLVLAWAARRHLQESERHAGELDALSALASTFGVGALVFGLVYAADHGWANAGTLGPILGGLAALALLVWNEARAAHPILPLRLFADRERAGAYAARVLFLGGMGGFWFFTTQLLQGVLGLRPALAGLAFLATTVPNFLVALAVPRLTRRVGNTFLLIAGIATAVVGTALLSQANASNSYALGVALPMALIGIGQGASLAPLTVAGMARVSPRDAGAGSGVINVAHQLGLSLGLAVLVVVFASAGNGLAQQIGVALQGSSTLLALACLVVVGTAAGGRPVAGP
jgi:MFS family permease